MRGQFVVVVKRTEDGPVYGRVVDGELIAWADDPADASRVTFDAGNALIATRKGAYLSKMPKGASVKKNPAKRGKRSPLKFSGVEFKPGNAEAFVAYHSPAWDALVESGWVTHSVQSPDANGVRLAHMLLDRKSRRKNPAPSRRAAQEALDDIVRDPQIARGVAKFAKKRAKKKASRKRNPVTGYVIHAQRGSGPLMHFNGTKFTTNGRPYIFAHQSEAARTARKILDTHAILRPYRVTVEPYSPK